MHQYFDISFTSSNHKAKRGYFFFSLLFDQLFDELANSVSLLLRSD
jgi:hypothetical protein